jgi:DNA-directed RNA polymerase specialized sigma24 family protein
MEAREFRADVVRLSSGFGRPDQELIVRLLEHSPAEAGRMLGIPRSTVHDKILRLRRRFVAAGCVPSGDWQ